MAHNSDKIMSPVEMCAEPPSNPGDAPNQYNDPRGQSSAGKANITSPMENIHTPKGVPT